jgi:hypothetical protein
VNSLYSIMMTFLMNGKSKWNTLPIVVKNVEVDSGYIVEILDVENKET